MHVLDRVMTVTDDGDDDGDDGDDGDDDSSPTDSEPGPEATGGDAENDQNAVPSVGVNGLLMSLVGAAAVAALT